VTIAVKPRPTLRFRGRSFMALVLAPESPLDAWLTDLEGVVERSPGFFSGRAIILDVSAVQLAKDEMMTLIADLSKFEIRIIGIEGADPSQLGFGLPPPISGGRPGPMVEPPATHGYRAASKAADKAAGTVPETPAPETPAPATPEAEKPASTPEADKPASSDAIPTAMPAPQPGPSLLIEGSVRSGQSIMHPEGDVIVLGSLASGAEVIAGGSIHIYGALRGRAIAGATGHGRARIFCRRFEAELIAIDGLYRAADDLDPRHRGQPVQIALHGDSIIVEALD
jgi:septum site-determining protein MinC